MPHKVLTIIGARPQIIKAAALSRAFRNFYEGKITEILVHTGQHYDDNMSDIFFRQMNIPRPHYNLEVGSASHAIQTARMMERMEEVFLKEKPGAVVIYGDTNSTLAAAVAASKIHIPVVHIEAGLRSFNKSMPEEINRIVADHLSTLLFTPTKTGLKNLINEGFKENSEPPYHADNPKVYHCGDLMLDNSLYYAGLAEKTSNIMADLELQPNQFVLCTIHRDLNTDYPERLTAILNGIMQVAEGLNIKVVLPLHPRTRKKIMEIKGSEAVKKFQSHPMIMIIPPAGFLEMCILEKNTALVLTDSGGVQKEAYYFKKPCVVFRPETEWVEPVEYGCTLLADADEEKIFFCCKTLTENPPENFPPVFGNGKAAEFMAEKIFEFLNFQNR
ncbi:MAG: UDP-N-acetylglucosamine 2-epimerase (non-hydrolyzing) [Bacteroidia bacterium]|nr:UDP-N-acetylglucosamine 2-epimerase (non-hydrolyzing) [Bacteroidia bacterium]